MFVNSISSSKTQIVLDYYSLPVSAPVNIYHLNQNLGNALSGDEYSNTLYSFNMLDDMESPQVVCKKEYSQDDISKMTSAIRDDYNVQWFETDRIPSF